MPDRGIRRGGTWAALATAALTVVFAACSPAPTPTPAPPTAEELRDRAAAALRQLSSAHFIVTHEVEGTDLGGGLTLTTAEGDVAFPGGGMVEEDRAQIMAAVTVAGFGLALDMGIVQIGEETYMRDPIGQVWRNVEQGALPFDFTGMNNSVADALAATTDMVLEEGGQRDGVATYLVTGLVPSQAFRGLVPRAVEGEALRVQAWVGRDDSLPRSMRLAGRLVDNDPPEMVRLLELTGFDRPVSIEPPI